MAITARTVEELVAFLRQHPEWREPLLQALLTEEFLQLPAEIRALREAVAQLTEAQRRTEERVEQLAEAQRRTEERVGRLEEAVDQLAEAQRRTEERLEQLVEAQRRTEERLEQLAEAQRRTEERVDRLEEAVAQLIEAQRRMEERLEQLAEAQRRTEEHLAQLTARVDRLAERMQRMERRQDRLEERVSELIVEVGKLKGFHQEYLYNQRPAYYSRLLRKARILSPDAYMEILEQATEEGHITEEEAIDASLADVVVRGRWRWNHGDGALTYLVVEVSWSLSEDDVVRAARRAAILGKAGYRVCAVVAGAHIPSDVQKLMPQHNVWGLLDGLVIPPESEEEEEE